MGSELSITIDNIQKGPAPKRLLPGEERGPAPGGEDLVVVKVHPKSSKLLAEFVGTFFLVLAVGYNVSLGTGTFGVMSIACTLTVMIYSFGSISGANFNPAVSLAVSLTSQRSLTCGDMFLYMFMQVLGGLSAGVLFRFGLLTGEAYTTGCMGGFDLNIGLAEFLYTFMLCYVVLNVAVERTTECFGLAIGFVVVAGGYGAGMISKGCFNPAISIGFFLGAGPMTNLTPALLYCLAELAGGGAAFGLSKLANQKNTPDAKTLLWQALINEFIGIYLLVLTVGLNALKGSVAPVLSIGSCLMCMVFAGASISGGHYNPAVTLAILASGRTGMTARDAALYIVVQIFGGCCAAMTFSTMCSEAFEMPADHGAMPAYFGELLATFVLCNTVLSSFQGGWENYVGFAVGMCVVAFGTAVGGVSGGSLNPAVTIGVATGALTPGTSQFDITNVLGYVVSEIFGGMLAACIYSICYPNVPTVEQAYYTPGTRY